MASRNGATTALLQAWETNSLASVWLRPGDWYTPAAEALAEAGLIVGEKRGRWMWWRVVPERVAALRDALQ